MGDQGRIITEHRTKEGIRWLQQDKKRKAWIHLLIKDSMIIIYRTILVTENFYLFRKDIVEMMKLKRIKLAQSKEEVIANISNMWYALDYLIKFRNELRTLLQKYYQFYFIRRSVSGCSINLRLWQTLRSSVIFCVRISFRVWQVTDQPLFGWAIKISDLNKRTKLLTCILKYYNAAQ